MSRGARRWQQALHGALACAACGCADQAVRLTVLTDDLDGRPAAGAIAVFQDRAGALIADGPVDAAGPAPAALPDGGAVTGIRVDDSVPAVRTVAITTIRGALAGDALTVGNPASPRHFLGGSSTMTVQLGPSAPGGSYTLASACGAVTGATSAAVELPFTASCHGTTFDLLAVSASNAVPPDVRYLYRTGLAYAAGGSVALSGSWNVAGRFEAALSPAPDDLGSVELTRATLVGATPAAAFSASVPQPAPGVVTAATPYFPGVGDGALLAATLRKRDTSVAQALEVRTGLITATWVFDLRRIVPWVANATATPTGVSWDQTGAGAVDARLVTWRGSWSDGARTTHLTWTIEDGERDPSLTLPALPEAYAAYDPARASSVTVDAPSVIYLDYDILDGYGDARPLGPHLAVPLPDLGALAGRPLQRRISLPPPRRAALSGQ